MPSFSQNMLQRWSLEWAALTGTTPCIVFGYKDFCGSTALLRGNKRADNVASIPDIISGLLPGRAEVLRVLKNFLNMHRPEHRIIGRLKERGEEKGSCRHSILRGWERSVFSRTNIGTVSRTTFGTLLRDGEVRIWAFPSATMLH